MRKKLIIFNLIIISMVIIMLTGTGTYIYHNAIRKSRFAYISELQKQLSNSFKEKIKSAENSLELMCKSDAVINYLLNSDSTEPESVKEEKVREAFHTYKNIYPEYINIIMVHKNGHSYISNDSYRMINDSFYNEIWFKEAMQNGSSYQFYNIVRNLKHIKNHDKQTYLSISKAVTFENRKIGVIMIDVSLQDLNELYRSSEPDTNSFFFLMNSSGQIILSPSNPIVYRIRSEWFEKEEGVVNVYIKNMPYSLIYNKYSDKNIIIVAAMDITKEQQVMNPFFALSAYIGIMSFILASSWSIYFLSRLTKPLTKLSSLMQDASTGNLDLRFEEPCADEIKDLGQAFNKMVIKIKNLLNMVYEEQRQKRDAELQVMQEQIKPHFLYNTFDLISWMARKHSASNIVHLIELMSNFFRISLSKGKELIPLADELKMVSSYMDIQMLRYGSLFRYEINCPEEVKNKPIPRMSIQPLVENCIYHGIKESDNETSILKITVFNKEYGISVRIEDNGKVIDNRIMEKLNHNLISNNWENWDGGFGIQNVGKRLWHSFAKGSGLSYSKSRDGFTVATLTIIYKEEE